MADSVKVKRRKESNINIKVGDRVSVPPKYFGPGFAAVLPPSFTKILGTVIYTSQSSPQIKVRWDGDKQEQMVKMSDVDLEDKDTPEQSFPTPKYLIDDDKQCSSKESSTSHILYDCLQDASDEDNIEVSEEEIASDDDISFKLKRKKKVKRAPKKRIDEVKHDENKNESKEESKKISRLKEESSGNLKDRKTEGRQKVKMNESKEDKKGLNIAESKERTSRSQDKVSMNTEKEILSKSKGKGKRSLEQVIGQIKTNVKEGDKGNVIRGSKKRESKRVSVLKVAESEGLDQVSESGINVNEVLDVLASNNKWAGANIFISPPGGNRSDEDSAPSDDEAELHHLSGNQLLASCELQVQLHEEEEVRVISNKDQLANMEKDKSAVPVPYQNEWCSIDGVNEKQRKLRDKVNSYQPPRNEHLDNLDLENHNWTHIRTFELIFDDELCDFIVRMTNEYAIENNATGWIPIDRSLLRCFLGILMLSGYVHLPSWKMFWEESPDVQQTMVKNAMTRNQFRLITQNIHFCTNSEMDPEDKCAKVRPLLHMLRTNIQRNAMLTSEVNVDESMIPYYGKFGQKLKQRMPMKPIRSGYKVWCLNLLGGYLYDFEVYQGKGSKNEFTESFGLGPSVVLGLLKSLPEGNFTVLVDNYFNTIPLMRHLKEKGYGLTGTMSADRVQDCPLPPKGRIKQQEKGYYDGYREKGSGVEVIIWNDNGAVIVGSNFDTIEPVDGARRWSKKAKEYKNVPRPHMIALYNKCMGGTDQMDQQLATYRPFVRNRKWYWPLFTYSLGVGLYNSWLLYRTLEKDCPFLDHLRSIAMSYIRLYTHDKHIIPSSQPAYHASRVAKRIDQSIRFDGKNHLIGMGERKSRCALCGKTCKKICLKCDVKLHDYCFSAFHGLTE